MVFKRYFSLSLLELTRQWACPTARAFTQAEKPLASAARGSPVTWPRARGREMEGIDGSKEVFW